MLHFDNVSKFYFNSSPAVEEISLRVKPGEFVSIVGHSGAGKSTLLKMILAEVHPTHGNVFFENKDLKKMKQSDLTNIRRRMGTIFQDFRLLPSKTVYENIAFAMEVAGKSDEDIATDVPYVIDLVDLGNKAWHFPSELSGGEQQRAAIARAIVNQPDILIADEPTGNLDPINTYEVVQILKKINDLGTTVVMTTHNKGVVDSVGRRVVTMDKGRIIRDDASGKYSL
jgi:cell division transport system ATP-binding protein